MKIIKVKATVTSAKKGSLTIRLFLTPKQKHDIALQRGTFPAGFFKVVVL